MGWIALIGMLAAAFALVWRYGNLPRHTLEITGAILLIGVAGYAWQGSPDQPGVNLDAAEKPGRPVDAILVETRQQMSGRFGQDAQWLDLTDRLISLGQTQTAVVAARSGLRDNRNSPALWVGLGNALVAHGDGLVSPAAEFAYRRAAYLSPEGPEAPFFYGYALAKSGQFDKALLVWKPLLARTPEAAPWRARLAMLVAQTEAIERVQP
jgi:cytochrome c-type biogenesis protein CcmH